MSKPNFLVIMSDQHNPHIMGCAHDPIVRTPNLDRLAGQGMLFSRNYCAGPLCVPSRMSFVTGRHPCDLRIWTNGGVLPSTTPTFAHCLNAAGYDTVLCGRMHFVGQDQNHGFGQRLLGDVSGAMRNGPKGEMFEGVWSNRGCGQNYQSLLDDAVGPGKATYEIYDEDVTARACGWLGERAVSGTDTPFCLVVGLLLPHNPYVCSRELFDEYVARLPAEPPPRPEPGEHPAVQALKAAREPGRVTPEQARRAKAAYYGLVTTLDRGVGRIVDTLRQSRLGPDTLVLYTSDHGDLCGEHALWWKDSFYEGSVRVPMIWSCPGTIPAGTSSPAVTSLLDVGATLADFAGVEPTPGNRGHSLRTLLTTGKTPNDWPHTAFAETLANGQRPARMFCSGRWKLNVYHGYDTVQLFDLEADPDEQHDRGTDPACREIRESLLARATEEWDGAGVERTHGMEQARSALVQGTGRLRGDGISEQWLFPAGGNVREDRP